MGNTSPDIQPQLGEITIAPQEVQAVLSCSISHSNSLQLILQDALGRSVLTKEFTVNKTTEALTFDVSSLKEGNYHAWIYIDDVVFVRQFNLEKKDEEGLVSKLLSIFK